MDKFTAFVLLGIGLVYSDLESEQLFYSLVLPGVVIASLLYLFWYRAFLALSGAALCYHLMDLGSQSLIRGGLMPFLFALCCLLFLLWSGLGTLTGGSGYGDGGDFGDFGGDGGGDAGGGGD
ncbi:MAG: hypothetical protein P8103_09660 [Candidatus Thiodiazotropha sp.]